MSLLPSDVAGFSRSVLIRKKKWGFIKKKSPLEKSPSPGISLAGTFWQKLLVPSSDLFFF